MKKLLSTVLATCLIISATACSDQNDDRIDPTTRVTESEDNSRPSEPNQSIASSVATTESESSETATTAPNNTGAYTYTAYGYQFTMDVNIDDYIFEGTVGYNFFDLYYLARDYGWRPHRADGDNSYDDDKSTTVQWYEYDFGDGKVMILQPGCDGSSGNSTGRPQLNYIGYYFRDYPVTGAPSGTCYDDYLDNPLHWTTSISIPNHSASAEWLGLYGGGKASASITREDAILLAYLITVGPKYPGETPLYYVDFYNSDWGTRGDQILPY